MAFELHHTPFPAIAASNVGARIPVSLDTGSAERQVVPIATNNVRPFGVTIATALQGEGLPVPHVGDTVKLTAVASVGVGAGVGVASSNGAVGPISGASGVTRWELGQTVSAAAGGEVVSVFVSPRQISNLI